MESDMMSASRDALWLVLLLVWVDEVGEVEEGDDNDMAGARSGTRLSVGTQTVKAKGGTGGKLGLAGDGDLVPSDGMFRLML
jgi:hypothetical protein